MEHELLGLEDTTEIVSFKKLYRIIWRMKWLIIAITLVFTLGASYYAIKQPNIYRANGIYIPAKNQTGGGLSQLAGQFGGLASMAGISLGGDKGDDNEIAIELLKSRSFLQSFIEKRNILPQIMAAEKWNESTNTLVYNPEIYDIKNNKWVVNESSDKKTKPTAWDAYYKLLGMINVQYMMKKGMVKISVSYLSPEVSVQWLNWLVEDLNQYWRQKDKQQAVESVEYLQKQIRQTNISEMHSIFYNIIAEQTQQILLTEVRKEYLFKTLAPIVTPEEKFAPSRALLCIVGMFIGSLIALLISFVYVSFCPERKAKNI
ncbi:Wzz/FepE/Etk N-terminal domain-containing protein [Pseudoalteromonas denitrificans]|uniref:Chain length determinant protein n=1 Tax=Pseudoalteromonas denitrificans DSM 6059 TaxID=1123010 RepID=A0A1I1JU86_9GAMM|nr:Wzz/FepE/Etk N-terminal domain-containing protein [Pseudoalteromonas denitrificans]SFC52134.1 Chain length determinant protein [Pseudoalteromonas denitrificans DSM 6059]